METKQIVTIDLGTHNLVLCIAEKTDSGKISVVYCNEFPSEGVSHGKVLNPKNLGVALNKAVSAAGKAMGIKITNVMVGTQKYDISDMDITVQTTLNDSECISEKELGRLEDNAMCTADAEIKEGNEVLSLVAQSFNVDDEMGIRIEDVCGMMGSTIEGKYKAFVGKQACNRYIDAAFNVPGITLARKVFVQNHIGKAVLSESEMDSGVALIDFGAGATGISIFYGGVLRHYGAIPFGGDCITSDIRNLCSVDNHLAENIKLAYGGCMPEKLGLLGDKTLRITDKATGDKTEITAKYLSEIITARTREIIEAMLYEIQESGFADKLKSGIVLVGGCAYMLNLCNFIKQISGYNARIGIPSRAKFNSEDSIFFSAACSQSAGLLLRMAEEDASCTEERPDAAEEIEVGTKIDEEITLGKIVEDDVPDSSKSDSELTNQGIFGLLFGSQKDKRKEVREGTKKEKGKEIVKEPKKERRSMVDSFQNTLFGDDSDPDNQI